MFPNLLTTIRIIAAPILVVLLIFNTYNMMLFGLFIFVSVASLIILYCDFLRRLDEFSPQTGPWGRVFGQR